MFFAKTCQVGVSGAFKKTALVLFVVAAAERDDVGELVCAALVERDDVVDAEVAGAGAGVGGCSRRRGRGLVRVRVARLRGRVRGRFGGRDPRDAAIVSATTCPTCGLRVPAIKNCLSCGTALAKAKRGNRP